MLWEGDSITTASAASQYTELSQTALAPSLNLFMHNNTAVSGSTTADLTARATSDDSLISHSVRANILYVMIGTNGLNTASFDPTTVAALETFIQSYCAARRSAGWNKIVVSTILPSTITPGFNPNRNSYNTWLVANFAGFADAVSDIASDPTIGPDAAASNPTYYPDGEHPSAAAGPIMQPYPTNAFLSVIPANVN